MRHASDDAPARGVGHYAQAGVRQHRGSVAFFRAFVVNNVSVTLRMVLPLEIWGTWLGRGVDSIEDPRRGVAGARELGALLSSKRGQHRGSGTPMRPFAVNVVFCQQIYSRCSKPKDL